MSSSPSPSSSASASPPPPDSLSAPPTTNPTPASPPPAAPVTPPLTASPPPSSPPPASLPPPASPPPSPPPAPPVSSPPPAADPPPPLSPPPPSAAFPPPPATPSPPPPAAISTPTAADPPPPPIPASPPPPNAASPPPIADTIPQPSLPSPPRTPTPSPPSSASPPPPSLGGLPTSTPPPPILEPPKTSPPSSPLPSASPPATTRSSLINSSSATTPSPDRIPSPLTPPPSIPMNSAGPISGDTQGGGGTRTSTTIVPVSLVVALFLLSSLGLALWLIRRRRKSSANGYAAGFVMPSPMTSSAISESPHLRSPTDPLVYHHNCGSVASEAGIGGIGNAQLSFSYDELYDMTNGFSTRNLLGEGGFGCVYKGCLPYGREVAVKQLKVGSGQGEREFKAEVEIISRVHHRHLVSLVGYCISESQRLLVYDYVPNGTLDSHLHGKEETAVLHWATRVKIAAGAARGIAYLHEDCYPRIIHRDIKSSNILLDNNFEAQVSDFGLARLAMEAKTHVTTRVVGTFGYLAPEYASSGKLTDRSDVYSFGVVLLELITGRKPVDDTQPMGEESLVEWARPRLIDALETRDFGEIPDPRLGNDYNENEMFRLIEAAAACIRHSATMRPSLGKVVRVLDALADFDLNNGVKPGQSKIFNALESSNIRQFQRIAFGSQVFSPEHSQSSWSNQSEL